MAWLSGWSYRKTVTITGEAGAGTLYQVDLSIGDLSGGDFHLENHCANFPNDIQVTGDDGVTPLDYWVEDLTVDPITMWVEIADDLGSNVDICVYYGKSSESSVSNGINTFEFFDDFEGASVDTDKWTDCGGVTLSGGKAVFVSSGAYTQGIRSISNFSRPMIVEGRVTNPSAGYPIFWIKDTDATQGYANFIQAIFMVEEYLWHSIYEDGNNRGNFGSFVIGTYYVYKQIVKDTEVDAYQNDVILYDGSYDSDNEFKVALSGCNGATANVDWVFVRKYASPEPAFSSAGNEEIMKVLAETLQNTISKIGLKRIFTETLQTVISKFGLKRIFAETLQVVDSISKTFEKIVSETLQVVISKLGPKRIFTETLQNVDSIKKTFTKIRTETLQVAISKIGLKRLFTETLQVAISKIRLKRLFTETLQNVDSIKKTFTKIRTETLQNIDSIKKTFTKASTETLQLVGTVTDWWARFFTEFLSVAVAKKATAEKTFSEAYSHSVSLLKTPVKGVSETIDFTIGKIFEHIKALEETLTLALSRTSEVTAALSESCGIARNIVKTFTKPLAETIKSTPVFSWLKSGVKGLNESLNFALAKIASVTKVRSETVNIAEDRANTFKAIKDEVISFVVIKVPENIQRLAETLSLAISKSAIFTKVKSETVHLAESRLMTFAKNVAESLDLARTLSKIGTKYHALVESLNIGDAIETLRKRVARKIILLTREKMTTVKSLVRNVKVAVRKR